MSEHYIAKKLKWDIYGAFDGIPDIKKVLEEELAQIPKEHSRKWAKVVRWLAQVTDVLKKLEYIEKILIPKIMDAFHYEFESPDLVKVIFFQPSIKKLFDELVIHFNANEIKVGADFEVLCNIGEAAKVMALLGDSTLGLAAVQAYWEAKISRVGNISQKRAALVSNENLARTCERLDLYDYRIHDTFDQEPQNEEKIAHVKGTLIEGIYGIIYAEKGIDAVFDALIAIK